MNDPDRFLRDIESRQRNIVFPDTVRNGRSVDWFLWHGSPNPPWVQRIGAWLFGLLFAAWGLAFLSLGRLDSTLSDRAVTGLLGLTSLALGARIFRNGFPKRPRRVERDAS